MKILKISGRNLASLAGDFCVDFEEEPLASSGLFAISGPTGAGKSTLLDALCLALYDATPRLLRIVRGCSLLPDVGDDAVSATDPRNLLRRGTSEAWAEVDFVGSEQVRYRARWSVRRSRGKVGGRLQDAQVTLHRLSDQAPLGGTKTETLREIEQRVGLSFEQFTRAVLLAQNEFSAFLKTEENERGALLETLTGSAIYSMISKRAYERFKHEEGVTLELSRQLAYVTPLDGPARAALDADSAAADAALAALNARQALLDDQLRWHDDANKLRGAETHAAQALVLRQAGLEDAAPRHQQLARLDAVQAARAPQAECTRLDNALAATRAAAPALLQARDQAESAWQAASAKVDAAGLALQSAEQAMLDAAPALDRAKALDAAIGVLAPAHRQAQDASASAAAQAAAAQQALRDKAGQLAAMHSAQHGAAGWLSLHQPWEALAAQWPRWDALFAQAQAASERADTIGKALRQADAALAQANAAEQEAGANLAHAAATLKTREAARQQAIAALAGYDPERLHADRRMLEQRRATLASTQAIWRELGEADALHQQLLRQSAAIGVELAGAEAALACALNAEPALAAALAQAERSLSGAELACAASVANLRATLADGVPCPVCGSAEHPYQHQDHVLQQMLASLREEVAGCRTALRNNLAASASARTLSNAAAAQLRGCAADTAVQAARLGKARAAWAALALEDDIDAAWFSARNADLTAQLDVLEQQNGALRRASLARDSAQSACDQAASAQARLQDALGGARTAQAQASASRETLAQQHIDAQAAPAGHLRELDSALAEHWPDWRDAWRAAPAAFRAARAAEAAQWQEQASQQAARAGSVLALQAAHDAASDLAGQRALSAADAAAALARLDGELAAMRGQRTGLWNGSPVAQVEQALAQAMAQARAALVQGQAALAQAAGAAERARSAIAGHEARLVQLEREALAAHDTLAPWRAHYPDLADLLACTPEWVAGERRALQALASAAEQAATVLQERRTQRVEHELRAPEMARTGVVEALALLGAELKAAQDAAGALRLRRALDDERRTHARAVLAEIEEQQQIERRWGRMNELIGSADGKKFRNYAQQFTLDVLLGYANSHLAQLARRYRLERVVSAAGPSLSLLVRDQDMGGEIRSVNSLSGGESFLVSLALALGLASLSSNRVRVESLFIDEGFGSLDSETLRVAMDALDGLQSMGRKVGVISHVQEMTERIAARIVVQPNGGGSSSVAVE